MAVHDNTNASDPGVGTAIERQQSSPYTVVDHLNSRSKSSSPSSCLVHLASPPSGENFLKAAVRTVCLLLLGLWGLQGLLITPPDSLPCRCAGASASVTPKDRALRSCIIVSALGCRQPAQLTGFLLSPEKSVLNPKISRRAGRKGHVIRRKTLVTCSGSVSTCALGYLLMINWFHDTLPATLGTLCFGFVHSP